MFEIRSHGLSKMVVKMFGEKENDQLERLNDWFDMYWDKTEEDEKKDVWVKRCEYFLCKKHETLNELKNRYDKLLDSLKRYEIRMSNAEKISKFADALPSEWDEFLVKLKKDSRFSSFI
ncbi:hypothetical protein Hanom_Chr02g00137391 [Helianthus anomalus]